MLQAETDELSAALESMSVMHGKQGALEHGFSVYVSIRPSTSPVGHSAEKLGVID